MTHKRHTGATSAASETEPPFPVPGYGPRASISPRGFLPDPNILTRRGHRLSEQSAPSLPENTNTQLRQQVPSEEPSAQPESGLFRIRVLRD